MNSLTVLSLAAASALGVVGVTMATSAHPRVEPGAGPCCTQGGGPSDFAIKHTLTLDGAGRVLGAAVAEARSRNAGGAIAIVDDGGSLIAFERIDGTFAAGAEVSIGKARTAAMFKKPTAAFEDSIKNGRVALVGVRELTPLQGGVPIVHEGQVIGAIGVSGAHSQQEDELIAMAGAAAIASTTADASK